MRNESFVFIGNRSFVLDEILALGANVVRILAVRGSRLEVELARRGAAFTAVGSKAQLVSILRAAKFDFCVANGCPHILPITELQDGAKQFVNVHPSPLPDLRGADPVPGSLLFRRNSGATCHVMDDGIDSGPIVARVEIPYSEDLDAGLLYQLSFLAEKEVFHLGWERDFSPEFDNVRTSDCLHYTRRDEDLTLDFDEPTECLVARIRAFSNASQGARFVHRGLLFKVYDVEVVTNAYLMNRIDRYDQNEVIFNYESSLLIRHRASFLKLKNIHGDLSSILVGSTVGGSELEKRQ